MNNEFAAGLAGIAAGMALSNRKPAIQATNTIGDEPVTVIQGMNQWIESLEYRDMVWVDAAAVGGSLFPAGTPEQPCKTLAEARIVAAAHNVKVLHLKGVHSVDADMVGYTFIMEGLNVASGNQLTCVVGHSINLSTIKGGCIGGVPYGAAIDGIIAIDCQIGLHTNPITIFGYNNLLTGNAAVIFETSGDSILIHPYAEFGAMVAMPQIHHTANGVQNSLNLLDLQGIIVIINIVDATTYITISGNGVVFVDVTCTFGNILALGNIQIMNAGTLTITDFSISNAVLVTIPALLAAIPTTAPVRSVTHKPPASAIIPLITITTAAADKSLGSIVVAGINVGGVVKNITGWLSIGAIENTNAAVNNLDGVQYVKIQKGAGGFTTCLTLPSTFLSLPATTKEGGRVIMFTVNVSAIVDTNNTYTLKLENGLSAQNNLLLYDVQWGMIVEYEV